MARLRIYDLDEQARALDLRDLLRLLAPRSLQANWAVSPVKSSLAEYAWFEATGEGGERLEALTQDDGRLSGSELAALAEDTRQDLGRIFRLVTRAARRDLGGDPGSRQHFLRDRDGRRGSVEHYRREVQGRSTGRGSSRRMASSSSPVNDGSRAMVVRAPHPACWPPSPRSQGEGDVWRRPAQGASRSFRIAHYALGL